jgi:hypothetical protein
MFDVWVELVCEGCSQTGGGQHIYGTVPRVQMKRQAIKAGWCLVNHNWFCRECVALGRHKEEDSSVPRRDPKQARRDRDFLVATGLPFTSITLPEKVLHDLQLLPRNVGVTETDFRGFPWQCRNCERLFRRRSLAKTCDGKKVR